MSSLGDLDGDVANIKAGLEKNQSKMEAAILRKRREMNALQEQHLKKGHQIQELKGKLLTEGEWEFSIDIFRESEIRRFSIWKKD